MIKHLAHSPLIKPPSSSYTPPDPFEVAVEHIAQCIRDKPAGWETAAAVFKTLGHYRRNPTWNDAMILVTEVQEEMVENVDNVRDGRWCTPIFPPAPPKIVHRRTA